MVRAPCAGYLTVCLGYGSLGSDEPILGYGSLGSDEPIENTRVADASDVLHIAIMRICAGQGRRHVVAQRIVG